jgi:hypothetical protein
MARKRVIDLTSATATIGKNQSGSLFTIARAAGMVITLPSAGRGLEYEFVVKTQATGTNTHTINVGGDDDRIRGTLLLAQSDSATGKAFVGDGSTHKKITLGKDYSATGSGRNGSYIKLTCDNDGKWTATGFTTTKTGAGATPFSA